MKTLLKKLQLLSMLICLLAPTLVDASGTVYKRYQYLLSNMKLTLEITDFIAQKNYLSDRLNKKWLHYLAQNKRWSEYVVYYQPTSNITRKCYYLTALYETSNEELALEQVKPLWLKAHKQPKACIPIFKAWMLSELYNDTLLWKRIALSITAKQYRFAKRLSNDLSINDKKIVALWIKLVKTPKQLSRQNFPEHVYTPKIITSIIKVLVKKDMQAAIDYWELNQENYPFSYGDKQEIYKQLALYSAIRNKANAEKYFSKLNPETTPDLYHEWRLRSALKFHRWVDVNNIIKFMPSHLQAKPSWQYWYARSFEKLGQEDKANALYAILSDKRNYYGFLASYRGNYPISMKQQEYPDKPELLLPHQSQISHINTLYKNQKIDKANLLSYELSNDLSKAGQYQLAKHYSTWQWHDKALMLTNASQYKNDLFLRFPLAHYKLIENYSKKYRIEEPFIYAIIRQESTFRKKVKSSAGALGLMQVIPATARKVSKKYRIKLKHMKQMYKPKTNINIGVAYLNILAKRFKDHPILMAAAYNAGPRQVNKWLKNPKKYETDVWIETLPWHETRNYLKNIMAFYVVYQYRLNEDYSLENFMKQI